jgi:hypothetical protein
VNIRRQLSLFVPVVEGVQLESVRHELDPVQSELIRAHVTLCREDEIVQLSASEIEARLQGWAKPLTLSFGPPMIFQGHGVLLPCVAGESEFHELRAQLLGTTAIRRHSPHITLAHPRNPPSAKWALPDAVGLPQTLSYTFVEIASIEQVGGAAWRVIREFRLISRPVG